MPYDLDECGNLKCCGKTMTYHFEWEQSDSEHSTPSYSDEDKWTCGICNSVIPSRRYSDWFGSGDLHEELVNYIEQSKDEDGMPLRILFDGYMVCLVYPTDVVVFGYDGNEYTHSFHFTDEEPKSQSFTSQVLGWDKLTLVEEPKD